MTRILSAAIVLVLVAFAYYFYILITAEERVRKLCDQITPGMPLVELKVFAEDHGLLPPGDQSGVYPLVEEKSYGRWGCMVEVQENLVKSSEYHFLD